MPDFSLIGQKTPEWVKLGFKTYTEYQNYLKKHKEIKARKSEKRYEESFKKKGFKSADEYKKLYIEYQNNHGRCRSFNDYITMIWRNKNVCDILKKHSEDLKDDPEKLSTSFIKEIICTNKEKCKGEKAKLPCFFLVKIRVKIM